MLTSLQHENSSRPWKTYFDNCTKGFLANVDAGAKWPETGDGDEEVNAVVHLMTVSAVASIIEDMTLDNYLTITRNAIWVWQNNDAALVFGLTYARILYEVVRFNSSIDDAIAVCLRNQIVQLMLVADVGQSPACTKSSIPYRI